MGAGLSITEGERGITVNPEAGAQLRLYCANVDPARSQYWLYAGQKGKALLLLDEILNDTDVRLLMKLLKIQTVEHREWDQAPEEEETRELKLDRLANVPALVADPVSGAAGLTKREWFAGLAMQGLLAGGKVNETAIADLSATQADQLIRALNDCEKEETS